MLIKTALHVSWYDQLKKEYCIILLAYIHVLAVVFVLSLYACGMVSCMAEHFHFAGKCCLLNNTGLETTHCTAVMVEHVIEYPVHYGVSAACFCDSKL